MFIFIPLFLIVISLVGILAIALRKRSYINKLHVLNTAGNEMALASANFSWRSYGSEFFPELKFLLDKMELHKYKAQWLMETEKFLRKARLLFLKIDRLSESWIKKIRKIHLNGQMANGDFAAGTPKVESEAVQAVTTSSAERKPISPTFLKNEEERLIIEIAKNPKDDKLYAELGDLYVEMNNWNDAKESYEAAIELNSKNESFKVKLSLVLERITQK